MPKSPREHFDYFLKSFIDKIFRKKSLTSILYILFVAFIGQAIAFGNAEAIIEFCDGIKEKYEPDTWQYIGVTIIDVVWGKGNLIVLGILGFAILVVFLFRYLDKKNSKPATKEVVKEAIDQIKQEEFTSGKTPQALNNIPRPPTVFIGRGEKMKEVEASLAGERPTLLLNGLGGIGKTALAMKYVNNKKGDFRHIVWISVDTNEEDLSKGNTIDAIANDIKLISNLKLEIPPEEESIDKVRTIFSEMDDLDGPNLLVIDNAGSSLEKLIKFLPKSPKWQVLITSRERLGNFKPVILDELPEKEALELFFSIHSNGRDQVEIVKELLKKIGRHTLTLELFANTCEQYEHVDPAHILKTLKNNEFEKLSEEAWTDKAEREVEIYNYLLAVLSIANLEGDEKKQLIGWSVLPSIPIDWDLIKQIFQVEEEKSFSKTLRKLWKKGWLIRAEEANSYLCHQMIQEVIRKQSNSLAEDCEILIKGVYNLLSVDDTKDNPVDKFPFVIYGDSILNHIHSAGNEIAILQNNLGLRYMNLGSYDKAAELLEKALASDLESFGEAHPSVAIRRSNLALVYTDLGAYDKAADLLEKALASNLESFGEAHPSVAIRRSNLALVYKDLGQYEKAAELLEKALASYLESFGEDHPSTASIRSNLGMVYTDLGAYEKAADLLEKALASDLESFGEAHPSVAIRRSNLALVYKDLGQYEKAAELLEKALASDLESFGEAHPSVAKSRSNLATVYQDLGVYDKAAELLEKALASDLESFGEAHPSTAIRRSNLALVYTDLGAYDKAADLLEKALASELESFGEAHPTVAMSRMNLGTVYLDLNRKSEAKELISKAYQTYLNVLGPDHPATQNCKSWLDDL